MRSVLRVVLPVFLGVGGGAAAGFVLALLRPHRRPPDRHYIAPVPPDARLA